MYKRQNIDRAVSAASVGRFFNCGQACLAVKRLYLHDRIADEFIEKLVEKVRKLRVGNGLTRGVMLGPLHTKAQREEVEEQVADAVQRGAKVLVGGDRPTGNEFDKGNFLNPSVLVDVDPESKMLNDEVFGPALPVVRIKDLEEQLEEVDRALNKLDEQEPRCEHCPVLRGVAAAQ